MINGIVVGIVLDNVDPDKMHRVKVEFPVDNSDRPKSSWCRMMTPMAGKLRGLVMLPDIGTEVVLAFAYRSMSPVVLGAVYNGKDDKPEPYHNDDKEDNLRVLWSRNDHLTIFDDTSGKEKVEFGAKAGTRLDVTSGPIWDRLDSAEKVITEHCEKDTIWETVEKISIKCKDFKLQAQQNIKMQAGADIRFKAGNTMNVQTGAVAMYHAPTTDVNPGSPPPDPMQPLELPPHKHPPSKG
jgi:uncharacterized protein involved in type VI secretion and phage assembly